MFIVLLYLIVVVMANLLASYFGPSATPIIAFFLIGFDMATRDVLHERWHKNHLWFRMLSIITLGALISWMINRDAGQVAYASFIAFLLSGLTDTVIYHLLRRHPRFVKVNSSNMASSLVDSITFPTIAFGVFNPWTILAQFSAKVIGGYLWSLLLFKEKKQPKTSLSEV